MKTKADPKRDIYILGAGGLAREVAFLIEEIHRFGSGEYTIIGYIDRDDQKRGQANGKYLIAGAEDLLDHLAAETSVALAVGNPEILKTLVARLKQKRELIFPNLFHPSTIMDNERVSFGEGNVICARNSFTTDIKIGSYNIFNPNCTIGHDVAIGDYCVMNPGTIISGGVRILDCCLIGAGAIILQNITIGNNAVVGAGAVVTKNVPEGTTVIGVPASPLERSEHDRR